MSQSVANLRVRRTQKLLREALVDLIEERGFDAVTVGEITGRALVSRAAFYRNYQDKYDLVEKIFDEAMQPLMAAIGKFGPERPPDQWVKLFEHLAENERLYRALLGGKGSFWFSTKMRAALAEMTREHALTVNRPPILTNTKVFEDSFIPYVLAATYVDAITWWLEQARPYSAAEMARRCSAIALAILTEANTWQ